MSAPFPLQFANEEMGLLTAIVLGFFFGFSLERGGFGSPRKLAAQFYLYDMAVFKVMFTAILVAMVGLYTLVELGLMDMSRLWVNPTFVWAQLLGGFLLGVGFIMSGLCPGTSVVSAASGRWDAAVAFLGIFVGTAVFAVAADLFPALEALYAAGSMGESFLPTLVGVPPLAFALAVVAVAGVGFIGAEKVEEVFSRRHGVVEHTPPALPAMKFRLVGALAVVALLGLGVRPKAPELPPVQMAAIAPLSLAEAIIGKQPGLVILDVRAQADSAAKRIPGAWPAATPEAVQAALDAAPEGAMVVLVDEGGALKDVPPDWRRNVTYRYLQDGFLGWELKVLTPSAGGTTQEEMEEAARQTQIAAFFSGAQVQTTQVSAPAPMAGGGGAKPKKKGGC
ncbi:MAG: YeeE/YedE thiosulfate transporter family protein [Longimicrobiales bacterium]